MKNRKSHDIVEKGLQILLNLDHRGAVGADPKPGDGCGMLVQIPHGFFAPECETLGFALPEPGDYAVGLFFLPRDAAARAQRARDRRGRRSPTKARRCSAGATCRSTPPGSARASRRPSRCMRQIFIGRGPQASPTRTISSAGCSSSAR